MDNLETNIKQLRMTVEELEKRIKAISSQVTVNTQVTVKYEYFGIGTTRTVTTSI